MKGKVLFTASTYSHILHFHLPYIQRFHEQGWSVHVACGGPHEEVPFTDKTLDLPLKKDMWSTENFRASAILRRNILQEGYALVSTHTSLAAFFTRLALKGLKKRPPVVNMVHGYLFDTQTSSLKRNLLLTAERWTAPQTDLLLTMNHWDYELAKQYRLGSRIENIPGVGIDPSRIEQEASRPRPELRADQGLPADAFILLYAAEFSKRKGQNILIKAMELLPQETVLVLAGGGALRQECQELARRLGVAERVLFLGYVQDMAAWYAAADAAVSSSRSEGLPFNIMEAMYAGLPVVASDVKGHQDLILDGVSGLLYPYGDACACARQITRLLESTELRHNLAEQAEIAVTKYKLSDVFPIIMREYASLLPDGGNLCYT
ncbi:MAG: glycosyltransferase [Oscillospiraceae bacterium]|nr:glycosyltransferase [Oscillospiraceae bacterium]